MLPPAVLFHDTGLLFLFFLPLFSFFLEDIALRVKIERPTGGRLVLMALKTLWASIMVRKTD